MNSLWVLPRCSGTLPHPLCTHPPSHGLASTLFWPPVWEQPIFSNPALRSSHRVPPAWCRCGAAPSLAFFVARGIPLILLQCGPSRRAKCAAWPRRLFALWSRLLLRGASHVHSCSRTVSMHGSSFRVRAASHPKEHPLCYLFAHHHCTLQPLLLFWSACIPPLLASFKPTNKRRCLPTIGYC